jgi:hypothetical protein
MLGASIDVSSGGWMSDLDVGERILRRARLYGTRTRVGDPLPTYFEWY